MSEITITLRTNENYARAFAKYDGTKSAGATRAAEGFINIRRYSLNELKGIFTTEEFIAITSSQNYMTLVPEYQANKAVLIAHLRDQERLQEGISDYGANLEDIERKINLMTAAQVFFLQDEIAIFWDGGDSDLLEFVKIYT
jgi:hypothetical protein